MPDFSKGFVYKITAPGTSEIYYGSATTNLVLRRAQHVNHYQRWLSGIGHFISAFHLLDISGWKLEKIIDFPCKSKEELLKKEGEFIKADKNAINFRIAGRTREEYDALPEVKAKDAARARKRYHSEKGQAEYKAKYEKNKEYRQAYAREYYQKNKQYFQDYMRTYASKYQEKRRIEAAEKQRENNVVTKQVINEFFGGNEEATS